MSGIVWWSRLMALHLSLYRMHLGPAPGNELFQGGHVTKNLLLRLWRRWKMKELVCHIPESGNLRVHQTDILSDGVYQHFKISSFVVGSRSQFSQLTTIPRPWQKWRRTSIPPREGLTAMTNQSSRWQSSRTPLLWANTNTRDHW